MKDILKAALNREMGGEDATKVVEISRNHAIPPTQDRLAKINGGTSVEQVAEFPSAAWRMVPAVEQLAIQRRVSPNMLQAAKLYVTLSYLAAGPSAGIGRYDSHQEASPSWSRLNTTDERIKAAKMFKGARLAAFGTQTKSGAWELDEALVQAIEPLLLADPDRSWTFEKIGAFLGSYNKRDTKSAVGVTELIAVLRRLRLYFRMGEDG
jgi:hypothetical protein